MLFSSIFPEIKTRVLNWEGRKELFLFNDTLNTLYLRLDGVGHMVKDHSDSEREETRYSHIGYSFRLAARVLLYASSHRQDNTYHGLCYTSRGPLAGTRNSTLTTELHLAPHNWMHAYIHTYICTYIHRDVSVAEWLACLVVLAGDSVP